MDIRPRLLAQTSLPGLTAVGLGYNVFCWPGVNLLVLKDGPQLCVYDIDAIVGGRVEPVMRLAVEASDSSDSLGVVAPSPGADFVVRCGKRELRALNRDGSVRWTHDHVCWGCADETDHSDRYACGNGYSGSAYVNADGTRVWAHAASLWDDEVEGGEQWLVLDARDGSVVASPTLASSASAGSNHVPLPDGHGMVLGIGYGQDGAAMFFGDFNSELATVTEPEDAFRIPLGVDPAGTLLMTAPHSDDEDVLALHRIPGGQRSVELRSADLPYPSPPEHSWWDFAGGFVDGDTIVTAVHRSDRDDAEHWLIDTSAGPIGPIGYGPDMQHDGLVALGDGRWATSDYDDSVLRIWER